MPTPTPTLDTDQSLRYRLIDIFATDQPATDRSAAGCIETGARLRLPGFKAREPQRLGDRAHHYPEDLKDHVRTARRNATHTQEPPRPFSPPPTKA